jgi:DNA-binding NarL/FixJ family response regulator
MAKPCAPREDMSAPEKHPVKTRIVVLEEHPLLRHGIAHLLNSQEDMIVCGETDNIRDARQKIQESKPHLLLTALRLGTGDSLEFLKALKSERPALLILVYSAFEMKKAPREELLTAIREILSGNENIKHKLDLSCSRDLVACAKKYVEITFVPPTNIMNRSKKKVVRFPAA